MHQPVAPSTPSAVLTEIPESQTDSVSHFSDDIDAASDIEETLDTECFTELLDANALDTDSTDACKKMILNGFASWQKLHAELQAACLSQSDELREQSMVVKQLREANELLTAHCNLLSNQNEIFTNEIEKLRTELKDSEDGWKLEFAKQKTNNQELMVENERLSSEKMALTEERNSTLNHTVEQSKIIEIERGKVKALEGEVQGLSSHIISLMANHTSTISSLKKDHSTEMEDITKKKRIVVAALTQAARQVIELEQKGERLEKEKEEFRKASESANQENDRFKSLMSEMTTFSPLWDQLRQKLNLIRTGIELSNK
ncbi:hypothetical protein ABW19_dt0204178 [Dactylella cylindrospora]|nr:hypothetical protein ABW19_dt0204178 [Dactylella cylindrospora]